MTLESRINRNRYIGNGATTQFPFTFKIWKTDQILVYIGNGTTEEEVSSDCTVNITASGGTVTFPEAPAYGTIIVIRRNMPYIQEDDYRNGTRFNSEEIEDRFDQDCAERQDLLLGVEMAVKVPETSSVSGNELVRDLMQARDDVIFALEKAGDVTGATLVVARGTTGPRALQDRFADVINVRDFGAVGDGVADDTAAFTAAQNSGAQAVIVPNGTYKITEDVAGTFFSFGEIATTGGGDVEIIDILSFDSIANQLANDIQSKVALDGSNVSAIGGVLSEYMAHAAMPSSHTINLTLPASEGTVTAPADGWYCLKGSANSSNATKGLGFVNVTANIETLSHVTYQTFSPNVYIPCSAGDIIKVIYFEMTTVSLTFTYANGSYSA